VEIFDGSVGFVENLDTVALNLVHLIAMCISDYFYFYF
jgi:hypothetical protein